jgi:hypothetical protein
MSDGEDLPVDARVGPDSRVTYIYADGRTLTLRGNHPYRDNNPGNLSYAGRDGEARARGAGALTVDPTGRNKFAVFPSVDAGEQALDRMIASHKAAGDTLGAFMSRYAPRGQNNLTAYLAAVVKAVKASSSDPLAKLSPAQIDILKETIRVQEGWRSPRRQTSPPEEGRVSPPAR